MKIFINLSAVIMTVVLATTVFAENKQLGSYNYEITGIVTDTDDSPIAGAGVFVKNTTIGVGTDSHGEFKLKLRESKDIILKVSCIGYKSVEVKLLSKDYSIPVRVKMETSKNQLDEIVVIGTREERTLKDVPIPTKIITSGEIEALNPASMEDLLQYEIPGLNICLNNMSWVPEISYQGMGGEYVLFLVDGERISGEGADHNVDFSRLNVDNVERIEIIRGAQATIYGSNALGGVINIITKKANRPFIAQISERYFGHSDGHNGNSATISAGCRTSSFSSLTTLTRRGRKSYEISDGEGKETAPIYGGKMWNFSQKLRYNVTERFKAELKGTYYRNKYDIKNIQKHHDIFSDYTIVPSLSYIINDKNNIALSYIFDNYKKDKEFVEAGYTKTTYRDINQTLRLDYSFKNSWQNFAAGIELKHENLKHYMFKDNGNNKVFESAAFLKDELTFFKTLTLVAGLRADYHDVYKWNLTPKFTLMYRPSSLLTFRAGYSRGFRSPSLKELYQEFDMAGIFMIYGNKNLKPEKSNQFLLSVEFTKGAITCSVSAFHNMFYNQIAYYMGNLDGRDGLHYVNAKFGRSTGVESIIKAKILNGLTLTGSYSYINDHKELEGKNISYVRPHNLTFSYIYSKRVGRVRLSTSMHGKWGSSIDRYDKNKLGIFEPVNYPARFIATANFSVDFPYGVSMSMGADNLFNYKDKAKDLSLQLPNAGRSFLFSLKINIADMFKL